VCSGFQETEQDSNFLSKTQLAVQGMSLRRMLWHRGFGRCYTAADGGCPHPLRSTLNERAASNNRVHSLQTGPMRLQKRWRLD
jgi:hypothetical protein